MATTGSQGITYPVAGDANNITADFQQIAEDVDALLDTVDADVVVLQDAMSATRLVRTTNIALGTNDNADIVWETETDPDGWWSSFSIITVPYSGIYAVSVAATMLTGQAWMSFVDVSGSDLNVVCPIISNSESGTGGRPVILIASDTYKCTMSEYASSTGTVAKMTLEIVRLATI